MRQGLGSNGVTDIRVTCHWQTRAGVHAAPGRQVLPCHPARDTPILEKLIGPVKVMIDAFQNGELDAVALSIPKLHQYDEAGTQLQSSFSR